MEVLRRQFLPIQALLIDDDADVCESVKHLLELEGFNVDFSVNVSDLIPRLEESVPDILLLDQNLAGQKGTDWLKILRSKKRFLNIPVIMLTGVHDNSEKVNALNSGADDYVVKPFSPTELGARIKAVLRRVAPATDELTRHEANGLVADRLTHQLLLNGQEISVTLTEFKIIFELLKNQNEVLSRDHLREMALGKSNVTDRTIDVHLAALRKKLGVWAEGIKTIRGVGYRYTP